MAEVSRDDIDAEIAAGNFSRAKNLLAQLWRGSAKLSTASFVVGRFDLLRPHLELAACRAAILRSFTLEPVIPVLRCEAFLGGIDLEVRLGDFNAAAQEILAADGWVYTSPLDVVILAVQTRDISPPLWEQFTDLGGEAIEAEIFRVVSHFQQLIETFRQRSTAHLIVHSLESPPIPANGILDTRLPLGQAAAIARINAALFEQARQLKNVYVLDMQALAGQRGQPWHDERRWLMSRYPLADGSALLLAREWLHFVHPIAGRICKVLAVDLDNTLWGGIVGEDGPGGIKLVDQYPGGGYRALQRAILDLHRRGILLAICSKNNPDDVMEVIDKHPGMLLRREHFAAMRINWNDKAANLREIADELNVGLDAIAFLDDSAAECALVEEQLPQVTVIHLAGEVGSYAGQLRQSPAFERLELTAEDQSRGKIYQGQRQRADLQKSAPSLEDFYRSLQMRATIEPITPGTLSRAAQLTQKTNQFNLTTRRYSEAQMAALAQGSGFTLRLSDRFGDNGIVGVAILRGEGDVREIDTFLLSCRVIGRTVETAFLSALAGAAKKAGATRLAGWFVPTKKNAPAAGFYARHGFSQTAEKEGSTYWELDLTAAIVAAPAWITVEGAGI
ncbi:MAG TPA: HAD-IIIC family phosphatase [Tepidisphaeraceae bacterium]|jgi:FkbH-like protein|nr:HAD-IIIC family phosphatase [Tepidisphaeraceae bacterium]